MSEPALSLVAQLPTADDLPLADQGYEPTAVVEALAVYRRHLAQLQAQLKVIKAAGPSAASGHPARMDALHLIRTAAEFADTLERDAQSAAAGQLERATEELSRRAEELAEREAGIERYREESEALRSDLLLKARNEIAEQRLEADHLAKQAVLAAEATARRLIEQARHRAAETSDATRAEVTQTLDWANSRAREIVARAQTGAAEMLSAAGMGPDRANEVADALVATLASVEPDKS